VGPDSQENDEHTGWLCQTDAIAPRTLLTLMFFLAAAVAAVLLSTGACIGVLPVYGGKLAFRSSADIHHLPSTKCC
jgi:hypothetical protein